MDAVSAVARMSVALDFRRGQFSFQGEVCSRHQHKRCNYTERNDGIEDRKNPPERLMAGGRLIADVPDRIAGHEPSENRNVAADARNFKRPAVSRAD